MELVDQESVEVFRQDARQYAQIDKLISETRNMMKPLQLRLKQLMVEKKDLEKEICSTMEANDLREVELQVSTSGVSGKIEYQVKKSMIPVTQKTIKEKMILFFESGPGSLLAFNSKSYKTKGEEFYDYIYSKKNRDFVTKEKLKTKDLKL
jgi:hypothetical protein